MKKILYILMLITLGICLCIPAGAIKYSFSDEECRSDIAGGELDQLLDSLPQNVRDKLYDPSIENSNQIAGAYGYNFFAENIVDSIKSALPKELNRLSASIGFLIIISLIKKSTDSISNSELSPALNLCTTLASTLTVFSMQKHTMKIVSSFLQLLSDTMLHTVPVIEAIYIANGNITTATVTSTAMTIMITFTESIFSKVLSPGISVCLILAAVSSVTGNACIAFISRTVRTLITTALILVMSLMTMSLSLQTTASGATDTFAARAIRFALGSYIPFIGGAVSESLSVFTGSLSLIKKISGVTVIVIIILICLGPIASLIVSRFTMYISENLAGILDCDSEKQMFAEIGGCYTLLLSVVISSIVMYIIALSQFCRASGAIG